MRIMTTRNGVRLHFIDSSTAGLPNSSEIVPGDNLERQCIAETPKTTPKPLKAIRQHCLSCCNGSALEVAHCPARSCPLWLYRFGRNATADMLTEVGEHRVYPLEEAKTAADFQRDATSIRAIQRRCLDCSGGSKAEVRNCERVGCDLHPNRLGNNPNRKMSAEQREIAAARLKANIERARRPKLG
jgi:hypothetical protein